MIRKNGNIVVDVLSSLGTAWLGLKDRRTFYIKKTITYGTWSIVWNPETVPNTSWAGGSVQINAYATRTNTIREGFNYRQETETEYCTITYSPTLSGCSLSGSVGAAGYTFTWGEYDVTTGDRTTTLTATHSSGTSTKVIKQTKRDKYVADIVDIAYTEKVVIPASGGSCSQVPYTYTLVYNTGERETKTDVVYLGSKASAISKGDTPSGETVVKVIPGSELGTTPEVDGVSKTLPDLTVYQAKNDKKSNHDAKTETTKLKLTANPTVVYPSGGTVTFTVERIYTEYSDSYIWDSGTPTPAVQTPGKSEYLTNAPITVTGGDSSTFNSTTYNVSSSSTERTFTFKATDITNPSIQSYPVEVKQLLDSPVPGSDTYENIQVSLSYSNVSASIPYTFSAAGGTLAMNDPDRAILTVTYTHKWRMVDSGNKSEVVSKNLTTLKTSEYTFNPTTYTARNLGTEPTVANNNLKTVTVTVKPEGTGLLGTATAKLTQAPNVQSESPKEGSETGVSLVVTASPKSLSYQGGDVTVSAIYSYTESYPMSSGDDTIVSKSKDVTTLNNTSWLYAKAESGIPIGGGTFTPPTYHVTAIPQTAPENIVYTFTATYNNLSGSDTVVQYPESVTITYENFSVQECSPTVFTNAGGDVYLVAKCTKIETHVDPLGAEPTVIRTENYDVTTATTWDTENLAVPNTWNPIGNISFLVGASDESGSWNIRGSFEGMTDIVLVTRTGRTAPYIVTWDRTSSGIWADGTTSQTKTSNAASGTPYTNLIAPEARKLDIHGYGYYSVSYWKDNNGKRLDSATNVTNNITFTAVYYTDSNHLTYYVSHLIFDAGEGSYPGNLQRIYKTVNYGTTFGEASATLSIPTPTNTNYGFARYKITEIDGVAPGQGDRSLTDSYIIKSSSITFTAEYKQYTITWDFTTNGGTWWYNFSSNPTTNVAHGTTWLEAYNNRPITSYNPSKPDSGSQSYTFSGWFDAATGGNQITNPSYGSTKIITDTTFYAQFTSGQALYTVTWDVTDGTIGKWNDGGTNNLSSTNVAYGTGYNVLSPPQDPMQSYDSGAYTYTFDKWVDPDGDNISGSSKTVSGNVTITAQWIRTDRRITVKWYKNSSNATWPTSVTSNTSKLYVETEEIYGTLYKYATPPGVPVWTVENGAYTMVGWFTGSTGGDPISTSNNTITSEKSFYAHWSVEPTYDTVSVTFNANGGTYSDGKTTWVNSNVTKLTLLTNVTLPNPLPTKTETGTYASTKRYKPVYVSGWCWALASSDTTPYTTSKIVHTDLTVYMVWMTELRVLWDVNTRGGTWSDNTTTSKETWVASGTSYADAYDNKPNNTPKKTGYTFKGWSSSSTSYSLVMASTTTITANGGKTFYAWFEPISYTITFLKLLVAWDDDSVEASKTTTATYGTQYKNIAGVPNVKRLANLLVGYEFVKWNTKLDGTGTDLNSTNQVTSHTTFYAVYNTYSRFPFFTNNPYNFVNLPTWPDEFGYTPSPSNPNYEKGLYILYTGEDITYNDVWEAALQQNLDLEIERTAGHDDLVFVGWSSTSFTVLDGNYDIANFDDIKGNTKIAGTGFFGLGCIIYAYYIRQSYTYTPVFLSKS